MNASYWKGDGEVAAKFGFHYLKPLPKFPQLIQWKKPIDGWWKLNCNGASKENLEAVGIGWLIRNSHGNLVLAFADFLEEQTNTYAELYAVVRGLQLARDTGCNRLWIEIDAMVVLHIIEKREGNWKLHHLLTHLRLLNRGITLKVTHVFREENTPTDFLVNLACRDRVRQVFTTAQSE
ncbi:UNVERIFIED_CONTAM: hypothetical protein Sradi_2953400 [Sesamum radiatum]|uniref:RNase H type-1 domain-containing protein n=1 Tax=Sesamum radiatum TaxID=300843 RepID=A0AAW2S1F6_SESRA